MFPNTVFTHQPVLAARCIELLGQGIEKAGKCGRALVIDGTLGLGGHSELILQTYPQVHLIGIDRDKQALARASRRLGEYSSRFTAVHATYDAIGQVAAAYRNEDYPLGGILMDLGVSSLQLDDAARGFSYARDTDLDMRMDQSSGKTAADLLAELSEVELTKILREAGEEKFASRIAREIVKTREKTPVTSSAQLVEIVRDAIPAPARRTGGNPAKRTFQALRIAVNQELSILKRAIPAALESLAPGGVMVVEAYQSLEDRIVKQAFSQVSKAATPGGIPVAEPKAFQLLINGAEKAGETEISNNPRAASVRLRAITKLSEPAERTREYHV
ncbi:MAG: 16S rRNA (cytosine(1402)-N(4))-methyltransferase RsmH [Varibaculum cambriense]|uniref:16S rRNA (cytosine(1402)-N(4))-methyltransferase RsmH n=1 Tax=Varibaculum cambriense TaxID=184870 RepID=UPI00290E4298|nr:16S rRNA (cytosine(1402)-N(4))-methyltransferase RsmH [Varibaculum cambriense]MDU4945380.1 16S rRNA (cytosine(1402)-N(4))-methyltransferase RsmH [Varibaculum cambriense]